MVAGYQASRCFFSHISHDLGVLFGVNGALGCLDVSPDMFRPMLIQVPCKANPRVDGSCLKNLCFVYPLISRDRLSLLFLNPCCKPCANFRDHPGSVRLVGFMVVHSIGGWSLNKKKTNITMQLAMQSSSCCFAGFDVLLLSIVCLFACLLAGWFVGWLVCWLVGWLVGWLLRFVMKLCSSSFFLVWICVMPGRSRQLSRLFGSF